MIKEIYTVETKDEIYEVTNFIQEIEIASLIADISNPIVALKLYRIVTTSTRDYTIEHLKVIALLQSGDQLEGIAHGASSSIDDLKSNLKSAFDNIQENI